MPSSDQQTPRLCLEGNRHPSQDQQHRRVNTICKPIPLSLNPPTPINKYILTLQDHIIQILGYTTGPDWAEIFLPLKLGNLKTLVSKILPPPSHFHVSNLVLHQMLLALHHLDQHNIIHRDLNPENILWEHSPFGTGDYHFTLADFGLSTSTSIPTSILPNGKNSHSKRTFSSRTALAKEMTEIAGTTPFMAPEMYNTPLKQQTSKVDIWSLFATVVWVRDKRFRKGCELVGPHLVHVWLNRIAGNKKCGEGGYEAVRRMACFDPGRRPSAGEQLEILEVLEMEEEEEEAGLEEEMPYYRQDQPYMAGAIGDYGWDGTDSAWSSEGYALPMEVPWDQEVSSSHRWW